MSIPEYMLPVNPESEEEHQTRLFTDWLYARGGNHPDDVARWLATYTPEQLARMYLETWGALADDEEDYVPADPDVDDDVYEVIDGGS